MTYARDSDELLHVASAKPSIFYEFYMTLWPCKRWRDRQTTQRVSPLKSNARFAITNRHHQPPLRYGGLTARPESVRSPACFVSKRPGGWRPACSPAPVSNPFHPEEPYFIWLNYYPIHFFGLPPRTSSCMARRSWRITDLCLWRVPTSPRFNAPLSPAFDATTFGMNWLVVQFQF